MHWLRSVLSIVLGYAATVAVVMPTFTVLERAYAGLHASAGGLVLLLAAGSLGGLVGGWVAAGVASRYRRLHAAILGAWMTAAGVALAWGGDAGEPAWFRWGLPLRALPSAALGGLLYATWRESWVVVPPASTNR